MDYEVNSKKRFLAHVVGPNQQMAEITEWPISKWMAKFSIFPKRRMAIHQIIKIQIGEWPVKNLFLANPNAY